MIKVLYLPLNAGGNIQQATYNAWNELPFINMKIFDFMNVHEVTKNKNKVNDEFIKSVAEFKPDLVHMQLQMTDIITPQSIKTAKSIVKNCIFSNWSGDVRNHASKEMVSISSVVDHTFISSTGQIELYKNSGAKNVRYWQIGYDHDLFYPLNKNNFKYDLVFAGNMYQANVFADAQKRSDLILKIKKSLGDRFKIFGSGYPHYFGGGIEPLPFNKLNEAYNDSMCILSISNYNDIPHYFSDRLLICMASGRPTISYRFPEYESYFSDNSDILIAHDAEEILSKVQYCKLNIDKANSIGRNGARKVYAEHTYRSRIIELLKILGLI